MQHRPLTAVESEYLDEIRRLSRSSRSFGIGDVAKAVGKTRSSASVVVNRLASFGEISLAPHFAGCVRAISVPNKQAIKRRAASRRT